MRVSQKEIYNRVITYIRYQGYYDILGPKEKARIAAAPTHFSPGSASKIEIMRLRAANRMKLFNEEDINE